MSFKSCCDLGAFSVTSKQITPWMFSLKHYIYVRWLPVDLTQMIILKEIHPSLYEKFNDREFIVLIANRKFSKFALDQNHARLNGGLKGAGRAIVLTKNDAALQKRLLEKISYAVDEESVLKNHNLCASVVKEFLSDVKILK